MSGRKGFRVSTRNNFGIDTVCVRCRLISALAKLNPYRCSGRAAHYPDQDQHQAGRDLDKEDVATRCLGTHVAAPSPRLNFRAAMHTALSQPRGNRVLRRWPMAAHIPQVAQMLEAAGYQVASVLGNDNAPRAELLCHWVERHKWS